MQTPQHPQPGPTDRSGCTLSTTLGRPGACDWPICVSFCYWPTAIHVCSPACAHLPCRPQPTFYASTFAGPCHLPDYRCHRRAFPYPRAVPGCPPPGPLAAESCQQEQYYDHTSSHSLRRSMPIIIPPPIKKLLPRNLVFLPRTPSNRVQTAETRNLTRIYKSRRVYHGAKPPHMIPPS